MASLIIFGTFALFLFCTVPIGVAIGLSLMCYMFIIGGLPITYFANSLFTSCDSFTLLAVPFFIAAGAIMEGGGLSRRLVQFGDALVGHFTGGLAMVTIVTCMFFAAISGSSPATVAAIGTIMVPTMAEMGYPRNFSIALVACAGTLGVIIPPSIPMVIYGVATNTSIGAMFLAGFGPGLLLALCMAVYAYYYCKKHKILGNGRKFSIRYSLKAFKEAIFALIVPIIILGGIYGGIFTPTEAAAVSVIYGVFAGTVIYRELNLRKLYEKIYDSSVTCGTVLIIVGASTTLGRVLTVERIPDSIANALTSLTDSNFLLMLLISVFLLFIGCIMETTSAILIVAPILLPVATVMGINPVHFGLIMITNLAIGFITPPVGTNLFVAVGISGIPFETLIRKIVPFIIVMLIAYVFIVIIEPLSMFLPKLLGYY